MTSTARTTSNSLISTFSLIAIASLTGCSVMPPMHPTTRLARLEERHGERMLRQESAEGRCEAMTALNRSSSLYRQAGWSKRAQRTAAAAQEVRGQCSGPQIAGTPAQHQVAVAAPTTSETTPASNPIAQPQPQHPAPAEPSQVHEVHEVQEVQEPLAAPAPAQQQAQATPPPAEPSPSPQPAQPEPETEQPSAQATPTSNPQIRLENTPPPEFFQHIERARVDVSEGHYTDALRHLLAAWQIQEEPVVMFDIAVCYEHLRQFQQALELYQRLASHPQLGAMANERIEVLRGLSASSE